MNKSYFISIYYKYELSIGGVFMEKATLTVVETAEYLGIGRNQTYRMINDGILPAVKIGRQFRIPIKSLEDWLINEAQKALKIN